MDLVLTWTDWVGLAVLAGLAIVTVIVEIGRSRR